MNSTELVTFEKGEARTTSLVIAEGTDNQHKAVIQLVRKYRNELEKFGSLPFQMGVMRKDGRGGEPTEYALLNEQQATLLITFMRNTKIVIEFKIALVRAFFELRDMARNGGGPDKRVDVNLNHTRGVTNPHGLDIKYNLDLTKIIQHPTATGLALLERLTGVTLDDLVEELPATGLGTTSSALVSAFAKSHLREVPGGRAVKARVYAAYCAYCAEHKARPITMGSLGRELRVLCPAIADGKTTARGAFRENCYVGIELITETV